MQWDGLQQDLGAPQLTPATALSMDETDLPGSYAPLVTVAEAPKQQDETPLAEVQSEFDPRYRDDFVGLLYVGKLENTCTVAGHRFRLLTPNLRDRLAMGPSHKAYANTVVGELAWRIVTVAAYLQEIDGQPAPEPLNARDEPVAVRLRWVIDQIHSDQMIDLLYEQTLVLGGRVRELTDSLDDLGEAYA